MEILIYFRSNLCLSLLVTVVTLLALCAAPSVFSYGTSIQHHVGDINLSGSEVMVIRNETYYQKGNITLRGRAKLLLSGARLLIDQTYHEEFNINTYDDSSIEIINSSVNSTIDMSCVFFHDRSTSFARNSTINADLCLLDSSHMQLVACNILGVTISDPGWHGKPRWGPPEASLDDVTLRSLSLGTLMYCKMSLRHLSTGKFFDWSFDEHAVTEGTTPFKLSLKNTSIENINFSVGGKADVSFDNCEFFQLTVNEGSSVAVKRSIIHQGVLKLTNQNATIRNLKTGYLSDWRLRSRGTQLPMELYINDSSIIEGWYLRLQGGHYEIYDSTIARFRPEFDDSSSRYVLHNCCVIEWMPWWVHGTVVFDNCVIDRIHTPDGATPTVMGSFCILQESPWEGMFGPWRNNSTITRVFPIQVFDSYNRPLAGQTVEIIAPDGTLEGSVITNQSGEAEVRITFSKRDYNRNWTLQVPELDLSRAIRLTSNSPITLPKVDFCPKLNCIGGQLRTKDHASASAQTSDSFVDLDIVCDGQPDAKWSDVSPLYCDKKGDTDEPGADIGCLYAYSDGKYLYCRFDIVDKTPTVQKTLYSIYIESPEWPRNTQYALQSAGPYVFLPSHETRPIPMGVNKVVEAAIPLAWLGYPATVNLLAETRPINGSWANRYDDTGWHTLVLNTKK